MAPCSPTSSSFQNVRTSQDGLPRAGLLAAAMIALAGCTPRYEREVIVYAALDAEFSRPILEQFERQTGIVALPKFDVESTKTVGLTQAIIAEANEPRCDVFWNNEILNTLRLEQRGLLEVLSSEKRRRLSRDVPLAGRNLARFRRSSPRAAGQYRGDVRRRAA